MFLWYPPQTTFVFLVAESPYQHTEPFFCLGSISWRKMGKGKSESLVWQIISALSRNYVFGGWERNGELWEKGELFKIRWLGSRGSWWENIGKTSISIKMASEYWEMNWTFQLGIIQLLVYARPITLMLLYTCSHLISTTTCGMDLIIPILLMRKPGWRNSLGHPGERNDRILNSLHPSASHVPGT